MQVIEKSVVGKCVEECRCEDIVAVTQDYVAVIDGATDKSMSDFAGKTGGRFASETLAEGFSELARDITIREAIDFLSEKLLDAARIMCGRLPDTMPCANLVCYSASRQEIWRVGDCGYRLNGEENMAAKFVDYINGFARRAMLEALLLEGHKIGEFARNDPGREFIRPILSRQHLWANLDSDSVFAYGIIDGSHVPDRFLECISVPAESEVVLCSDGYTSVEATLKEAESALRVELDKDPARIGDNPSTKGLRAGALSFDDRAYIRLRI